MKKIGVLVLLLISFVSSEDFLKTLKNKGQETVAAVATPVEKAVVGTVLKQCDVFKSIFGVSYEQLQGENEPDVTKLTLDLWSGSEKEVYNITNAADELLASPKFDKNKPVVIFLHGFLSSSNDTSAMTITKALIAKGGLNVLALDSSKLIGFFYLKSSTCVQYIGETLGKTLATLVNGGVDRSKIHLIGHSLGSHISGFAGQTFTNITGKTIYRITGLDPAGPCFFREKENFRLSKSDADFVDVIHTDAGVLGLIEPLGQVDFYPSKGEAQPGCVIPPCSHSRSWALYAESITDQEAFPATKCNGWDTFLSESCENNEKTYMGYGVDRNLEGNFYLKTKNEFPFGFGTHQTTTTKKPKILGIF